MVYTPTLHNYIKTLYMAKYYVDGHHHVCALCARHVTYMHIGEASWSSRSINSCDFQGKSLYALSGSTREDNHLNINPTTTIIFFHTLQCRPDFMLGVESLQVCILQVCVSVIDVGRQLPHPPPHPP